LGWVETCKAFLDNHMAGGARTTHVAGVFDRNAIV